MVSKNNLILVVVLAILIAVSVIFYPKGVIMSDEYSYLTISQKLGNLLGVLDIDLESGLYISNQKYMLGSISINALDYSFWSKFSIFTQYFFTSFLYLATWQNSNFIK